METNSLMDYVNNASGVLGILGVALNITNKRKGIKIDKQIDEIDISEHKKIGNMLVDAINIEKMDKIIAENASLYKNATILHALKEETKNNLLAQIYSSGNIFVENKNHVDAIVYEYIEILFSNINQRLSFGEKCILKESNIINNKLDNLNDLFQANSQDKQIIKQAGEMLVLLKQLMEYINLKQVIIRSTIIGKMDIFTSPEPKSILKNFNYLIDTLEFEKGFFGKTVNNVWEFFAEYTKSLDTTQNLDIEEYYYMVVLPTISCYEKFESKDSNFHRAVGAIGLFQNYTEDRLVENIINNIVTYLSKLLKFLADYNSKHNSQFIEEKVYGRFLFEKEAYVKKMLTPETEKLLYDINETKEILDSDLALKYHLSIQYLRKLLLPFIETVIHYKYYNKSSTILMISHGYKETISKLLRKQGDTHEI